MFHGMYDCHADYEQISYMHTAVIECSQERDALLIVS